MDASLKSRITEMIKEAVDCEMQFATDVLSLGVAGMSTRDMQAYLGFVADQRLERFGLEKVFIPRTPFHSWNFKTFFKS